MNRASTFVSILWLSVIAFFFSVSSVHAKSYSIPSVDITAQLEPDGSMKIKEQRVYSFDGDYTFAYQYINFLPNQNKNPNRTEPYELSAISLCDELKCYRQLSDREKITADTDKPVNTFYIDKESSRYEIRWFFEKNKPTTFTLSYTVDNAITRHPDVSELYWQWVGDEWEINQSQVSVNLETPPGLGIQTLQLGYGPSMERSLFLIPSM
jgi:uncharacterized membrane protein